MKRFLRFLCCGALLAPLIGCNEDINDVTQSAIQEGGKNCVHLSLTGSKTDATRANAESWEEEDAIGLFVIDSDNQDIRYYNNQYSTVEGDGVFEPVSEQDIVYMKSDGSASDLIAYYPYQEDFASVLTPTYTIADWSDQSETSRFEFSVSNRAIGLTNASPFTNLSFERKFAKVVFNLTANSAISTIKFGDLVGMEAVISGVNVPLSYNLLDDTFVYGEPLGTEVNLTVNEDGTCAFGYVAPENESFQYDQKILTLKLSNGNTYTYDMTHKVRFESGNCYTWTMSIAGDLLVMGLTVTPETASIEVGNSIQLEASIMPLNAANKLLSWTSSNTKIATVDIAGQVKGLTSGTVTITATTMDGSMLSASSVITVDHATINGHQGVDLGLPSGLLWATMNVGATNVEDYGNFFSWGETESKGDYDWPGYSYCDGTINEMTKYVTKAKYGSVDNKTVLDPLDDAASLNWRGTWRMPTHEEQQELMEYCVFEPMKVNNINGCKVTGPNGEFVFLPYSGSFGGTKYFEEGLHSFTWSRSLNEDENIRGYSLIFPKDFESENYRAYGRPIRGVTLRKQVESVTITNTTKTIKVNQELQMRATVNPKDADNKLVLWSTSTPDYVIVNARTGHIKGKKAGTAYIVATAADGSKKSDTYTLKVANN